MAGSNTAVNTRALPVNGAGHGVDAGKIEQLVQRMKSLHGGDSAMFPLIDYGGAAVPALRQVLYERDASGIFEPRVRAAKALAAIGARDVLLEFLAALHKVADPVSRLGEEAVVNAAARVLIGWRSKEFYEQLKRIAQQQLLPGIIQALADFRDNEAIPILVAALGEDFSRSAAEDGLAMLGASARQTLAAAATSRQPSPEWESPSSLRRRRSAIRLLLKIGVDSKDWPSLRPLIQESDPTLAFFACKLSLASSDSSDRAKIIRRLITLLKGADWFLARDIEDCLVQYFPEAQEFVNGALRDRTRHSSHEEHVRRLDRVLHRVKARVASSG
jgi:hypothetical protein